MYEVYISPNSFSVSCLISDSGITKENKEIFNILSKYNSFSNEQQRIYSLKKWELEPDERLESVFASFDSFIESKLVAFENSVSYFVTNAKKETTSIIFLQMKSKTKTIITLDLNWYSAH